MRKRLLSLFCALSLLLTLLPTSAFAVENGAKGTTAQTKDTEAAATATEELELTVPQVWEEFTVTPVTSLPEDQCAPALYDDRDGAATEVTYSEKYFGDQLTNLLPDKLHTDIAKTQGEFAKELYDALCSNVDKLKKDGIDGIISITLDSVETSPDVKNLDAATQEETTAWKAWKAKFDAMQERSKEYLTDRGPASNIARSAIAAFDRDRSDIFWLDDAVIWFCIAENGQIPESTEGGGDKPVTVKLKGNTQYSIQMNVRFNISNNWVGTDDGSESGQKHPERIINTDIATVNTKLTEIVKTVDTSASRYEQLKNVHDWLTKNNVYNENAVKKDPEPTPVRYQDRTPWEAISALDVSLSPVCEGYARAFKLICDKLSIPCVLVSGTGSSTTNPTGDAHMWNYVQMEGGKWYAVDVTRDDPVGATSGDGVDTYFLVGANTTEGSQKFTDSHKATSNNFLTGGHAEFAYPVLNATAYQRPVELEVKTAPKADEAIYGDTLNNVRLNTESAVVTVKGAESETAVTGTWAWQNLNQSVGDASDSPKEFTAVFTPDATKGTTYETLTAQVSVTVKPKTITLTDANFGGLESSYPYEDKAVEPKFTLKDGDTIIPAEEYTVSYSDNDKAGTATITIADNKGGNYTVSGTKTFTITPKAATIMVTANSSITYDGNAVEVGTSGTDLTYTYTGDTSKTPTFTFYTDENCAHQTTVAGHGATKDGGAPKNAGTYWVKGTVEASDNYAKADSEAVQFTIGRATYNFTLPDTIQTDVQVGAQMPQTDSTVKAAGVEVDSQKEDVAGKLEWFTDSTMKNATTTESKFTTVGTTPLWWRFTPTAPNYSEVVKTSSMEFTVSALPVQKVTFTGLTDTTVTTTYGTSDEIKHEATNSVTTGGGAITYASSHTDVATVDKTTGAVTIVGAGETTITATAAAVDGQYAEGTASYTLTVNKATLTIESVELAAKTYDGKTTATVDSVNFGGLVNSETLTKGDDYTVTGTFDTADAGENKTVIGTVTLNNTGTAKNYTLENDGTFNKSGAKIEKANQDAPTLKISGNQALVDGFVVPILTAAGGNSTGKYVYTSSKTDVATVDENGKITILKAGETTFTVKRAGDTNYKDSAESSPVTLNVLNRITLAVSDTKAVDTNLVAHLKNQGAIDVDSVLRDSETSNNFTVAVKGNRALIEYASSNVAQGTHKWIGLLIGQFKVNGGAAAGLKTLWYASGTAKYEYTKLGDQDVNDAAPVGGDGTQFVLWIKTDAGKTQVIHLKDEAGNEAHLTINFTEYTAPVTPSQPGGGSISGSGTVKTDTVTNPDGSVTKTETKRDGTVIETTTGKDGSVSKTTTNPNGSSVTETKAADGSMGTVKTDERGQTTAQTTLSSKAIETAKRNGEPVKAPVEVNATRDSSTAPTVKIELPRNSGDTNVEIPVTNVKPGTVAVIVHPDGTEEIVKNSLPTEDGIQLTVNGGATVKIVDNSKDFIDTQNHWAKDAIDFVSARGLVDGMNAVSYAPDASTTRAQLWTILARQNDADLSGGTNWYEKAQLWAKDKGVSDGANPNAAINRAQMVTMLWRTMGQPAAASGTSFADVPADSYYAQAVAWAIENGITAGVGGGRFDPNSTCTRGQIVTFLYRYMK